MQRLSSSGRQGSGKQLWSGCEKWWKYWIKKCWLQRFVSNVFESNHIPTVSRSDYFPSLVYDCSIVEVKSFKTSSGIEHDDIHDIVLYLVSCGGYSSCRKLPHHHRRWMDKVWIYFFLQIQFPYYVPQGILTMASGMPTPMYWCTM